MSKSKARAKGAKTNTKQIEVEEKTNNEILCPKCSLEVENECIECYQCRQWFHKPCTNLENKEYQTLKRGNEQILWICLSCLKHKGDETKKFLALEDKMGKMMDMMTKLEQNLIVKIEEKIDRKIEEKLDGNLEVLEKKVNTRLEAKQEEVEEKEKRKHNIILWNLPESTKESHEERKKDDIKKVQDLVSKITKVEDSEITNPSRMGKL